MDFVNVNDIRVASALHRFIEEQALPGSGITPTQFWGGLARILEIFTPRNHALLALRDDLQAKIDSYHRERKGQPHDPRSYRAFLEQIGYLKPEPPAFQIGTRNVDLEVATLAGPQLVVPALNTRFALNAANARWGSLYDALYGTDALPGAAKPGGYDAQRGAAVIAFAKSFLDRIIPLASGQHGDVKSYSIAAGMLRPALADPTLLAGYRGAPNDPSAILLRHHGLHIEIVLDRTHPVGKADSAGIADILLESALTTIIDLEDSVAAVDAGDKVAGYASWLGLMKGDLHARFEKGGRVMTRALDGDRNYVAPDGSSISRPGRSLLFIRNVGHLMTTPAVQQADGTWAPEGILDAAVTSLIALHDLKGQGRYRNSRAGSVYIVKPKMHGPDEAAFTDDVFAAVEDMLALARNTIKVGVMDEERRTSANLAATIFAVKDRIAFINTGFLDRTGDEIHTSMQAGAMIPKAEMKTSGWLASYEKRNVQIGLACGFSGRAQIGKGMWAAPDRMADMMQQKIAHPKSGANTAWVPSPTAATLHALHYHDVDVFAVQTSLSGDATPNLDALLAIPIAAGRNWTRDEITRELDNNAQGILGYVVRWIDQGVGCSKVPDINDIGLMEDRATLRISSQHMANWLMHGVCSAADIDAALMRMAVKVDQQNAGDSAYQPMAGGERDSLAFQAARALIFEGAGQPNGYTEPLLHSYRSKAKLAQAKTPSPGSPAQVRR